jgi:hypothetical protein
LRAESSTRAAALAERENALRVAQAADAAKATQLRALQTSVRACVRVV